METQKLAECYKESLEYVLACLEEEKSTAKWPDLPADIIENTDCKDFVKTRNLVRDRLDKHIRKVDDCGIVLKRIWNIRKKHKSKMKSTPTTLSTTEDSNQFRDHLKALIDMETTIEQKDDIPIKSPDDATSQALSQERKETEKRQQSTDEHEVDSHSVDKDNQDVVIGDNSKLKDDTPIKSPDDATSQALSQERKETEKEELCQAKNDFDEPISHTQKEEQDRIRKELEIESDQLKERVETSEKSLKDENKQLSKIPESELNDDITKLTDEKNKIGKENENMFKELEQLRNECDRLEAKVKKLKEMNTGLNDENERYKLHEKEYNKVTEENTAYQQRCKAYEKHTSKLQNEHKALEQRYEELEDYTKILEDNNSKHKQRSLRPQTAPHSSARQYQELKNEIATLTADKESLMQRLSMVAGMKLRDNNPGIADLSDPNRPEKLAEQFREIYDNGWTNLLDDITDNNDNTDDIAVQQIITVTQKIFEKCQEEIGILKQQLLKIIGYPEDTFENQYTGRKDGHDPIVKMMKDLVQISAERIYESVLQKITEIGEIKTILRIGGKSADVFLTKCSKLCLFMCVKDPPVVLDFQFKRGDPFDKDKLSAFTRSGDIVDYLVWPVMYLNENGPVMSKGVVQGRKK